MTDVTQLAVFVFALGAAVVIVGTIVAIQRERLLTAVARRSDITGLPLGSPEIVDAITARLRRQDITMGTTAVAGAAVAVAGAFALADRVPSYILVAVPVIVIAVGAAATVDAVTRPLFTPAVGAPRVARASTRRTGDYLGPLRRALPWCITAAAATWILVLALLGEVTFAGFTTVAVAAAGLLALPWVDRAVVEAPQAASHSLELAWDDAFRADALGTARLTVCLVALTSAFFGLQDRPSWSPLVLNLSLAVVGLIYARAPLRAALRPPWLAVDVAGRR